MKLRDDFEGEIIYILHDGINLKALFRGIVDVLIRYNKMIVYDEKGEYIYRCEYCDMNDWYDITEVWHERNFWLEKSKKNIQIK